MIFSQVSLIIAVVKIRYQEFNLRIFSNYSCCDYTR